MFVMLVLVVVMIRSGGVFVSVVMLVMVLTLMRTVVLMAMFFMVTGKLVRVVMFMLVVLAHRGVSCWLTSGRSPLRGPFGNLGKRCGEVCQLEGGQGCIK
jgi:hypothetical protein